MKIEVNRPWVGAAAGVAVLAAAVGGYLWYRGGDDAAASAQVTSRLVSVSTGTIRQSVSTTGTLAPAEVEDVSFGTSATVTGVAVTVGQKVAKGQVLGTIDPVSLDASLAQAQLQLANAKATLAATDDSTTDAQLAADKTAVSSASSAVTAAQAARAKATLRSPIAGVVAEVNASKGAASAGGGGNNPSGSSSSTSADFVVVGTASWTVSASVDDTQIGLVAVGDQAQITTDNVTGTVFGTVSSVSVLSSSTSGSASYPVTIAVTGTPSGLHDGASATVSIVYKQLSNVLTVPTLAVHTQQGASYVYVSVNGTKTKRTVTTGLASGGSTQIRSGLTSGQQVYVDVQTTPRTSTNGTNQQQQGNFPGGGFGGAPGGGNFGGGNFGGGR